MTDDASAESAIFNPFLAELSSTLNVLNTPSVSINPTTRVHFVSSTPTRSEKSMLPFELKNSTSFEIESKRSVREC